MALCLASGKAFIPAVWRERFCVRNSGGRRGGKASAIMDAAEYMTNGRAVVLGQIGKNAAGMSGKAWRMFSMIIMMFILDPAKSIVSIERIRFQVRCTGTQRVIQETCWHVQAPSRKQVLENFKRLSSKFRKSFPQIGQKMQKECSGVQMEGKGLSSNQAQIKRHFMQLQKEDRRGEL